VQLTKLTPFIIMFCLIATVMAAIDTRSKRQSVVQVPTVDNTVTLSDMMTLVGVYGGIIPSVPSGGATVESKLYDIPNNGLYGVPRPPGPLFENLKRSLYDN